MKTLDYTVEALQDGTFEVWTPDITGACIGTGATNQLALLDAIECLRNTADVLAVSQEGLLPRSLNVSGEAEQQSYKVYAKHVDPIL